jgi:hypothetical protein
MSTTATFDSIFARVYAMEECIANGYVPTEDEKNWLDWAQEKIADWSSDVEPLY